MNKDEVGYIAKQIDAMPFKNRLKIKQRVVKDLFAAFITYAVIMTLLYIIL